MFRNRKYGIRVVSTSALTKAEILQFRAEAKRTQPVNSPVCPLVDVQEIVSRGILRSKQQNRKINFGDIDV